MKAAVVCADVLLVSLVAAAPLQAAFQSFPVVQAPGQQVGPVISDGVVAYVDNRNENWDIYAKGVFAAEEVPICTNRADQYEVDIDGNLIVWEDWRDGSGDVYGLDLRSMVEFPVVADVQTNQTKPGVNGAGFVVWQDDRNGNHDIYGTSLVSGEIYPLCTQSDEQLAPTIEGSRVAWWDGRNGQGDIYAMDLNDWQEFLYLSDVNVPFDMNDEGVMVWAEIGPSGTSDIFGFHKPSETFFEIAVGPEEAAYPQIDGSIVVWMDDRNGDWDIYGTVLPEPATAGLVAAGAIALLRRRRHEW